MKDPILLAQAIDCEPEDVLKWNCTINTDQLLGIKQNGSNISSRNDAGLFVQDVFLGATFFIWTLVTIALVRSGLKMIFSWGTDPKAYDEAKKWVKYSLIGLVLVIFSYTIVRLIQYMVWGRI